jgi:regulator of protease activity HflC (stomatin/prohibitin superfamily)
MPERHGDWSRICPTLLVGLVPLLSSLAGCVTVQPGHRGLYFHPSTGLSREPLLPGRHWTGIGRVEDFDITYSTRLETVSTNSSEGLQLELRVAVIYRPVINELYELLTEIGPHYYEEVIGPEFRSAARGIFARHSYLELFRRNEHIEDEVEKTVRRRCAGKHIEILSITLEAIHYAPEIKKSVRERLVDEQEAARAKVRAAQALQIKEQELHLARLQAQVDKVREESEAQKRLTRARSEAEAARLIAEGELQRARAHTPLSVMAAGYEALKTLAGNNVHVMLGDWSKVPAFLFPGALPGGVAAAARR